MKGVGLVLIVLACLGEFAILFGWGATPWTDHQLLMLWLLGLTCRSLP